MRALLVSVPFVVALVSMPALAQPPGQGPAHPDGGRLPATRVVTEAEMQRYLVAIEKLVEIGGEAELQTRPDEPRTEYSERMVRVIEANGFTMQSFTETHWNVMLGYMALEIEARAPEQAVARAELQRAKQHMPPEQYEAMMKRMSGMMGGIFAQYGNVPPENVALVKSHKAALDEALKRDER
jgi:hypothetical protein